MKDGSRCFQLNLNSIKKQNSTVSLFISAMLEFYLMMMNVKTSTIKQQKALVRTEVQNVEEPAAATSAGSHDQARLAGPS